MADPLRELAWTLLWLPAYAAPIAVIIGLALGLQRRCERGRRRR